MKFTVTRLIYFRTLWAYSRTRRHLVWPYSRTRLPYSRTRLSYSRTRLSYSRTRLPYSRTRLALFPNSFVLIPELLSLIPELVWSYSCTRTRLALFPNSSTWNAPRPNEFGNKTNEFGNNVSRKNRSQTRSFSWCLLQPIFGCIGFDFGAEIDSGLTLLTNSAPNI